MSEGDKMFIIKYKKNGRNKLARDKSGNVRQFSNKEKARQFLRNHAEIKYEENVKIASVA